MIRPVLPRHLQDALHDAAAGLTVAEEAARHGMHPDSIKLRRRNLCRALGVRSREEAVAAGYRLGLLDLKPMAAPDVVLADGVPVHVLVEARTAAGLTLQQAAALLGRSAGWLLSRETGHYRFGWNELRVYAQALDVTFDWDVWSV